MATELIYPTAEGTQKTWNLGAGSDKVSAVQTNDGDSSYIQRAGTILLWQDYEVDPSQLGAGDTINSVTVKAVVRSSNGGTQIGLELQLPGGAYGSGTLGGVEGTYNTISWQQTSNPDTGQPWVPADLNGTNKFEVGIGNLGTGFQYFCTQIFAEIDFTTGGILVPVAMATYRRRRT